MSAKMSLDQQWISGGYKGLQRLHFFRNLNQQNNSCWSSLSALLRHSTEGALVPHKNSPEDHWHPTMQWDAPHLVQLHERSTPPWMQTLYLCHLHSATEPCTLVWPHWAATFTPQLSHYWAQNIHSPANWTAFSISAHTRSSCYTLVQHRSASTPLIPSP